MADNKHILLLVNERARASLGGGVIIAGYLCG